MSEVTRKLKELKIEDYIWLVYYFIVTFAIISNQYERNYVITKDKSSQKKSNKINRTILITAFFIYLYFVLLSFKNIDILKRKGNTKEVRYAFQNLIAQILFLVGGAYSIYADFDAKNTDVDVAIGF